ncbi:CDP-diacylglycerol--serine O-phosphatidyltransferase [Puniceicoccaceae bacterium K14]|nr:CDP-diacylglycerol--serine O-phosphatidyltransferase [Puniceicoccaceae bacterium K14]
MEPDQEKQFKIDGSQASRIYLLPNMFTAGNLFFGFMAIRTCIEARFLTISDTSFGDPNQLYTQAVLFILAAMFCDSLDGRVARMGGRESLFGAEFDSIVDMVSFGLAPALMVLFLILNPEESEIFRKIGFLLSFVYLLCAGVRLARFNVITHPAVYPANTDRSNKDFIGLPVPAAAGMISTLVLLVTKQDMQRFAIVLPFLMLLISYLMISSIRYPSFKTIDWSTKIRFRTFVLLLAIGGGVYLFRQYAFVIIFLAYLLYGLGRHLLMIRRLRKNQSNS